MAIGYAPKWMPLLDGIKHVQRVCRITRRKAWVQLQTALREGGVESRHWGVDLSRQLGRDNGIDPTRWYRAAVLPDGRVIFDYDGRPVFNNPLHPGHLPSFPVEVSRSDVQTLWPNTQQQVPAAPGQAAPAPVYHTGLTGRPSSWQLIDAEFRRRWASGERHPDKFGSESAAEWADVLVPWLTTTHKGAPTTTEKTVRNKLAGPLRELNRGARGKP